MRPSASRRTGTSLATVGGRALTPRAHSFQKEGQAMISVSNYRHLRVFVEAAVFALLTVASLALLSAVGAQTTARRPQPPPVAQPVPPAAQIAEPIYREYGGLKIGMSKEQVRQKLG